MHTTQRAAAILERLKDVHGEPARTSGGDPVGGLVGTILSQNTSDTNSHRAMESLRAEFPTWDDVLDSDPAEVADAIRSGGLADQKAPTIQRALRQIKATTPTFDAKVFDEFSDADAMTFLTSIKGVGKKTAACVLMFDLERDVLPVDTHVHRVSRRIGLVPPGATAPKTQDLLEQQIAPDDRYAAHVLLIRHGRRTCKARIPNCEACVLTDVCDYFASMTSYSSD